MDPRVARVPIALSKDDADRDPVVRWIRSEFSKLDEVPTLAAYATWSVDTLLNKVPTSHRASESVLACWCRME